MFLLANKNLRFDNYTSLLCASLFLFNGFFVYRAISGHVAYLSYIFIPLYCFFLIQSYENQSKNIDQTDFVDFCELNKEILNVQNLISKINTNLIKKIIGMNYNNIRLLNFNRLLLRNNNDMFKYISYVENGICFKGLDLL